MEKPGKLRQEPCATPSEPNVKAMAGFGMVVYNTLTGGCLPGYMYTPESLVTGGYETDTSMLDVSFGRHLMDAILDTTEKVR